MSTPHVLSVTRHRSPCVRGLIAASPNENGLCHCLAGVWEPAGGRGFLAFCEAMSAPERWSTPCPVFPEWFLYLQLYLLRWPWFLND